MRSTTITIQTRHGFHPADTRLAETASVRRIAVHHLQLLEDGSYVLLYELRGELEHAEAILDSTPEIFSSEVSGSDTGLAFIHAKPIRSVKTLLELLQRFEIAIEMPIKHVEDDAVEVTLVGEDAVLQQAMERFPNDIDVVLKRTGQYRTDTSTFSSVLTVRQEEILTTAVEAGYFEIPRQTTQAQLAHALDIAPSTLHEHLRRIEQRLVRHHARTSTGGL